MKLRYVSTILISFSLFGTSFLISGCSGRDVARALGLQRDMPNEYTVTTRKPLSMPPSDELVKFGKTTPQEQDESERLQALETLSPDVALSGTGGSTSEGQTILINRAISAADVPDNDELGPAAPTFSERVMFWKEEQPGSVVDAEAENRRLKRNLALGKPITKGTTPTKQSTKEMSIGQWLHQLF